MPWHSVGRLEDCLTSRRRTHCARRFRKAISCNSIHGVSANFPHSVSGKSNDNFRLAPTDVTCRECDLRVSV